MIPNHQYSFHFHTQNITVHISTEDIEFIKCLFSSKIREETIDQTILHFLYGEFERLHIEQNVDVDCLSRNFQSSVPDVLKDLVLHLAEEHFTEGEASEWFLSYMPFFSSPETAPLNDKLDCCEHYLTEDFRYIRKMAPIQLPSDSVQKCWSELFECVTA